MAVSLTTSDQRILFDVADALGSFKGDEVDDDDVDDEEEGDDGCP